MIKRIALPFIAVMALLSLFYVGLGLDSRELPSPLVGKPAPAFAVESLHDPDTIVSEQDFSGDVSLVNVWASWCSSCRSEKPHLIRLANQGVTIHGINYRDTREDANGYLRQSGNPYRTIAFDPKGDVGMDWGVYATPETYVLDADGTIRHKHIGPLTAEVVRDDIIPLIERLEEET